MIEINGRFKVLSQTFVFFLPRHNADDLIHPWGLTNQSLRGVLEGKREVNSGRHYVFIVLSMQYDLRRGEWEKV